MSDKVEYLGFLISGQGIDRVPAKVDAINAFKFNSPVTLTMVRSFLGMCSYYRRFIPEFSKKAKPINDLLKK